MERVGLGQEVMRNRKPRLVYGRLTGWGQVRSMACSAGHDINYISLADALAAIGTSDGRSMLPLNLVGNFGGGSMSLAFVIMAARWERDRSGMTQVVDAAIVDGVSSMMSMFTGFEPTGRISLDRARNPLWRFAILTGPTYLRWTRNSRSERLIRNSGYSCST